MRRLWAVLLLVGGAAEAQDAVTGAGSGDSVAVRFADVELSSALQTLGRYLDRPLLVGQVPTARVTFETPVPVHRSRVPDLIRGLAEGHGLEFVADSAFYRVRQREQFGPQPGPAQQAGARANLELRVLRLRHSRASDVAGSVGALYGIGGAGGGPSLSSGTLSDELRRNVVPADQQQGATPSTASAGGGALAGEVIIVPDEMTNSLLVRAAAADHDIIRAAVEQLDIRPLQALIQVLIVEVRRDHQLSIGTEAETGEVSIDGDDGVLSGILSGTGLGTFALRIMNLGSFDLDAVLGMSVARGQARIVSRPVVIASNNREARILVGSQRPFIQVSRSLPTDAPSRDQVVQYKDVGTSLSVLPTINADGYISMLIRQEVNSATAETQFDAPVISTRSAETEVMVRDGQTIVLGGLRERQHELTRSGVPVLSELPLVGGLFGSQVRRTTETELFFFITPLVISSDEEVETVSDLVTEDASGAARELVEGWR